jgi:hypothetical protein
MSHAIGQTGTRICRRPAEHTGQLQSRSRDGLQNLCTCGVIHTSSITERYGTSAESLPLCG